VLGSSGFAACSSKFIAPSLPVFRPVGPKSSSSLGLSSGIVVTRWVMLMKWRQFRFSEIEFFAQVPPPIDRVKGIALLKAPPLPKVCAWFTSTRTTSVSAARRRA
jgi:hypothetical protein